MSRRGRRKRNDNGFEAFGGYMAAKKAKLEEQFEAEAQKEEDKREGIFSGVAIFVNGYTDPTADELKRIMMMNGGIFHHYQSSRTTHIIAINLPDTKVKNLKGTEPICHPKWIVDSLKAGKLLNFTNYLLYSNVSSSQPKINFAKKEEPKTSKAKDAKDEKFLGEFYNNSRLHHISTMGANFKEYVNDLRSKHDGDFSKARSKLLPSSKSGEEKVIMHIDMDCFFVSVGLRNHPHLKGKPVAVTHSKGHGSNYHNVESLKIEMVEYEKRLSKKTEKFGNQANREKIKNITDSAAISMSEIASCSYEARAKGIKNGMFMGGALKLCPELETIPYDFESYQNVAKALYDTVAQYTLDIQAVSCDEMLVDLSDLIQDRGINPEEFAEILRQEMREKTDCNASVGLGSSILLARMATKKAKPNGVFHLLDCDAIEFCKTVHVSDLPGVGRTNSHKFKAMGIENCGQLQEKPLHFLKKEFGPKLGQSIYNFCRGLDDRPVNFVQERKSVSAEVNYGIRFSDGQDMERFVGQLSDEVAMRLVKAGNLKGKQITLKVMVRAENAPEETAKFLGHGLCDNFSKGSNLSFPTGDSALIKKESLLLMKMLNVDPKNLRGIGIQVSKLEKAVKNNPNILNFVTKAKPTTSKAKNTDLNIEPSTSKGNVDLPKNEIQNLQNIDEDVLKELPEDIRAEIEAEREKSKKKNEEKPEKKIEDLRQQDLSFSQFDASIIAQLPENIVEELKQQYGVNKVKIEDNKPKKTAFEELMSKRKAVQTPEKQVKRRGRPAKNSPRFIKKSVIPVKETDTSKKSLVFEEEPKKEEILVREVITLNGISDIKDVRNLFRDWISTCENATSDDIEILVDFLKRKMNAQEDEFVYSVMKSLCRFCMDSPNPNWTQIYNKIVSKVQEIHMSNHHGKRLYLSFRL